MIPAAPPRLRAEIAQTRAGFYGSRYMSEEADAVLQAFADDSQAANGKRRSAF